MWRCATISVACRSRLCTCESATAVLCMRVEVSFCRGVGVLLMSLRCRGVQCQELSQVAAAARQSSRTAASLRERVIPRPCI